MNEVVRRVVTGHDRDGKAIVISDGPAPSVHTSELRPGHRSTDIWRTASTPATIDFAAAEPTLGPRRQLPPANGTVVRISQIPPDSESVGRIDRETAKKVFASMGNESGSTFAAGGRHPMMHRTESIDYAIVLDGEIFLVLDDSEVLLRAGDVVVQCGTNHAWSNRSDRPCRMAFILIDGAYEPELKRKLTAP